MIDHLLELQPHRVCLLGAPELLWQQVIANLITAAAYFAIPLALEWVHRRQSDARVAMAIRLFQLFIVACGMSHVLEWVTMFWPYYQAQTIVDVVMAAVSLPTAILLWMGRKRIIIR